MVGARFHRRDHPVGHDRFRSRSGIPKRQRQRSGDNERRRPRQQQSHGQHHHPRARGRTDRTDCSAIDCRDARNQIDPKSDRASNYGYDENAIYSCAHGFDGRRVPKEDSRREFFKRAVRALRSNSAVRVRRDEQSLSHDVRRPAANTKLTAKII